MAVGEAKQALMWRNKAKVAARVALQRLQNAEPILGEQDLGLNVSDAEKLREIAACVAAA